MQTLVSTTHVTTHVYIGGVHAKPLSDAQSKGPDIKMSDGNTACMPCLGNAIYFVLFVNLVFGTCMYVLISKATAADPCDSTAAPQTGKQKQNRALHQWETIC